MTPKPPNKPFFSKDVLDLQRQATAALKTMTAQKNGAYMRRAQELITLAVQRDPQAQ